MSTFMIAVFVSATAFSQCGKDHRSDRHGGILVVDFTIAGTTTLDSVTVAKLATPFIGSCYNDDSEELQERVRIAFQDLGYFAAEIKNLSLKPTDPLRIPKPVAVEAAVVEGLKYRVGEVKFLKNHAFSSERLRTEFPMKKGNVFERTKSVGGLDSLRRLYGSAGYLDFTMIVDTEASAAALIDLIVTIEEGQQYHMGKLEIRGEKEEAARLQAGWRLAEGSTYDSTYIERFITENHALLPDGFTAEDVRQIVNCPEALVSVSLNVLPDKKTDSMDARNIPCDDNQRKKTEN